jgi:hypothetical protein
MEWCFRVVNHLSKAAFGTPRISTHFIDMFVNIKILSSSGFLSDVICYVSRMLYIQGVLAAEGEVRALTDLFACLLTYLLTHSLSYLLTYLRVLTYIHAYLLTH